MKKEHYHVSLKSGSRITVRTMAEAVRTARQLRTSMMNCYGGLQCPDRKPATQKVSRP